MNTDDFAPSETGEKVPLPNKFTILSQMRHQVKRMTFQKPAFRQKARGYAEPRAF
jgi:hypothetical protein